MCRACLRRAKRGRQANLSYFAFTATSKHKTLAVFGRNGEPVHRYTMRQAIEEGFIFDVLEHYTTYATYYRLLKACADDSLAGRMPGVEGKAAATVSEADLRGLRKLREATGRRFVAGVVLYDGSASIAFGDGLFAVPVRRLWETA